MYSDIEQVASTLPRPFHLTAHSFGGYFAVRLAATRPDWVDSLMLMNTASHIPAGLAMRVVGLASPLTELLSSPEGLLSTGGDITRFLIEQLVPEWDCEPYYPKIDCPTLVVLGGLDPLVPLALGKQSAGRIAGATTKVLPVGFHIAMWEQPRRLAEWFRELSGVRRAGTSRPA
jgi:pimeloyl-ACP methyl ester carboxylesterase